MTDDAKETGEAVETGAETLSKVEEMEPQFIGDFDTFDAVREFQEKESETVVAGDMAVVNGALVRYNGKTFDVIVANLVDEYAPPADHTEVFAGSLTRLEALVVGAEFESGKLLANVRDLILDLYKNRPKAWTQMSQAEMRDMAKKIEDISKTILRKAARVIAEGEEISVAGKLESFNCKGGFDLKISAPGDEEAVVQLFRMTGHDVVIMSADASRFLDADEAETIPDEPELGFADAQAATVEAKVDDDDAEEIEDDSDLNPAYDELEEQDTDAEVDDGKPPLKSPSFGDGTIASVGEIVDEDPLGIGLETADEVETSPLEPETGGEAGGEGGLAEDFTEATPEELAAQTGRASNVESALKADYEGEAQPTEAEAGETWYKPSDGKTRHLHPNRKWYLTAATPEALAAAKARTAERSGSDNSGFPETPED